MTEDVDPETPHPAGSYQVKVGRLGTTSTTIARTIATGPATDAESGDDRLLSFTAAGVTADDRERLCVGLTPRALHEFYIETKDLTADSRMAGHTADARSVAIWWWMLGVLRPDNRLE